MSLWRPGAARQLALLTLAVLVAHLLVLGQASLRQPARSPDMRTLLTRVIAIGAPGSPSPVIPAAPARTTKRERPPIQHPPVPPRAEAPPPAALAAVLAAAPAASEPATPIADAGPAPEPAAATAAPVPPVTSFAIPRSVRLRYDVTGLSRGQTWNVGGQLVWRQDGSDYEATLEYRAPLLPSHSQQSSGRITAEGLAPLRFSDKGRSEQATHFERDSGTLIFSSNAPQQPLLPGAQDRLSVFLQLASMLAAEPAKFPAGTGISVVTAGTRDAEPWLFTVDGDEMLVLPGGTVPTRKLIRVPAREYDVRVELWLGIGMDYVPVRIRLTQSNGDYVDEQWSSTDRP
ncbi:MAG: hypothetical protein JWQ33_457 [Ramlibacter sp.]|nr:hypothetical protein [Ramlibacter sp.]